MIVKCRKCYGKGIMITKNWGVRTCDICQGKGEFNIPDNKELCPNCNGKCLIHEKIKYTNLYTEKLCEKCAGTGYIDKE